MLPKFLICGLEHTGTTLVSDLFRQVPGLDSGFECGVLLRDKVSDFKDLQPFARNMLKGWGITQADLDDLCANHRLDHFYRDLYAKSTVLAEGTTAIFDKTPRYLSELSLVLGRIDRPVVVTKKDPRALVCSDFKRSKVDNFDAWYETYAPAKKRYVSTCYKHYIMHADDPRVASVSLEELAMNSRATMERMFEHVGETFKLEYAIIDQLRYKNVKNKTVSPDIAFEFKSKLSAHAQARILEDFGEFDAWVYS